MCLLWLCTCGVWISWNRGRTKIYLSADCHWLKGCSQFKLMLIMQKNDSLCREKWWWGVGHQAGERHRRPGEGGWWEGSQEAQKTANHPDHPTETGLQGLLWGVLKTLQKGTSISFNSKVKTYSDTNNILVNSLISSYVLSHYCIF